MNGVAPIIEGCAAALLAFEVPSFGQAIAKRRRRCGWSQAAIAAAANVTAGYYVELESCRRLAPPRSTVIRIARALRMTNLEASHLVSIADAERDAAQRDALLPPQVRRLMATIRAIGPELPPNLLDEFQERLNQAWMTHPREGQP